ncbi:MAG: hypothetical protein ACOC1Z_05850 [Cyanobacteriota bacterium]
MGNICVIGPRGSGKTTYLAALAYWPDKSETSKIEIQPLNDESRGLVDAAENIVRQGEALEATRIADLGTVDQLPYYSFNIEAKLSFWSRKESIQLNARDYPGEIFEKIAEPNNADAVHEEFIDECLMKDVVGCLILLTAWEGKNDTFYDRVMGKFLELMDERDRASNLRLAIAMSKCERGELWPGRIDPETEIFKRYLPRMTNTLKRKLSPDHLRFYALSTFGVLGRNDPRPNRVDLLASQRRGSVLRDEKSWQPYNMIPPLYWLSRGK